MDPLKIFSFAGLTFLFLLIPGPSICFTVAVSLKRGVRSTYATILGQAAANIVQLAIVFSGLNKLFQTIPISFMLIKWGGVLYLAYLGIRQWIATAPNLVDEPSDSEWNNPSKRFFKGFVTCFLNPQAILFFTSFFPLFLERNGPLLKQFTILGMISIAEGVLILVGYGFLADFVKKWLAKKGNWRIQARLTAILMVTGGVLLAISR